VKGEEHETLGAQGLAGEAVQLATGRAVRMGHIDALENLLAQSGNID